MEVKKHDASILDGRPRGWLPVPWRSGWGPHLRTVVYFLILYGSLFVISTNILAATTVKFTTSVVSNTNQCANGTNYQNPPYWGRSQQGSCWSGGSPNCTFVSHPGLNVSSYGVSPSSLQGQACARTMMMDAYTVASPYTQEYVIRLTSCPAGQSMIGGYCQEACEFNPALPAGDPECVAADVCENGGDGDPYTSIITTTSAENPGLCAVGDFAESTSSACVETPQLGPGSYCTASVTTEVEYTNALPPTFTTTQYISYDGESETCEEPLPPIGPTLDPGECGPPPPTCAEGQILQGGSCVTYLPPINTYTPPTFAGNPTNTTTTTTTTTTTNPDGSVTTVSVSESQTEQGECPPGEKCDADYVGPDLGDDVKTFGESLEAYYAAIDDAPILAAVGDIGASVPESSVCPTWEVDFDLAGTDFGYTLDGHCQVMEDNTDLMRTIMAIVWSLLALFILLGA